MTDLKQQDLSAVSKTLPEHYTISATIKGNGIRCQSLIGISDDLEWEAIKAILRLHFKQRLSEFYHNTCTNHIDFIIYLK